MENEKQNAIMTNEDSDIAYGSIHAFESETEFTQAVEDFMNENATDGETYAVISVRQELCICTEEGIPGDTCIPVSLTDVELERYYIAELAVNEPGSDV